MKPKTADGKLMVFNQSNGKLSAMRIIVGVFLAILFILKDLAAVIVSGITRLFTEPLRWVVKIIVTLTEEITATFIRVILQGVEEFLNVVIGKMLQAIDNGSHVIIRGLRQMVSLLGYLVVVVVFSVAHLALRIISFFFSER